MISELVPSPLLAATDPFASTEFLVTVGLLVGVLLIGAIVLVVLDQWKRKQLRSGFEGPESLTTFRALYERGEITEEEYKKVRDKVATTVKAGAGKAPTVVPPVAEPPVIDPVAPPPGPPPPV